MTTDLPQTIETLQHARLAFKSVQQSLMRLQDLPSPLLNLATFPVYDLEGTPTGTVNVNAAIQLLRHELDRFETKLANYRASLASMEAVHD